MVRRRILFFCSWVMLALGVIGIFLPVMPTAPFLLAAAFGFERSSPRFHRWLTGNVYLKRYLDCYRPGQPMPRKAGWFTLACLWGSLTISAFLWRNVYYWSILAIVLIATSWFLLRRLLAR